jgi:hypothetical protein
VTFTCIKSEKSNVTDFKIFFPMDTFSNASFGVSNKSIPVCPVYKSLPVYLSMEINCVSSLL